MQAWNLKVDGCIAITYELGIWKWNPKRALPWSVLGSDNIKPWLSLTGMEKRVNYAISGQNLDIVTKTSDKNLLILTQVCITAELFWKLERIVLEIYTLLLIYSSRLIHNYCWLNAWIFIFLLSSFYVRICLIVGSWCQIE